MLGHLITIYYSRVQQKKHELNDRRALLIHELMKIVNNS